MPTNRTTILSLALALTLAAPAAGHAEEREPTPEERAAIEQVLTAQGYTRWEEIELEDDMWEVEGAVHTDGRTYDLKLRIDDLAVAEQEEE